MGCSSTREKIEARMLMLKLQRVAIKRERQQRCEELSKLTGEPVTREGIPDYEVNPIVFDKKDENKEGQKDSKNELRKSKTEQMNLVFGLKRDKTTTADDEEYEDDLWKGRQRYRLRHLVTRRRRHRDDIDFDDNDRYSDIDDYEERRYRHDDDFIDDSYNNKKYYDDEDIDDEYKNIEEEDEDQLDVEEID